MKIIFALFFLIVSFLSLAQVKDVVPGSYGIGTKTIKNYVKNPYCFANTKDISAGGGATISKTPSKLEGDASCLISSSSAGGKIKFNTRDLDPIRKNGNCLVSFGYEGDGSKWKVYVESNGVVISPELTLVDASTSPLDDNHIPYICGELTHTSQIVFEAIATAPTMKVSSVFLTKNNRIVDVSPFTQTTSYGKIQFGTVSGSVFTKGTNSKDDVSCRIVGDNYECIYTYIPTSSGSAGSGDLIINLPSGIEFDSSYANLTGSLTATTIGASGSSLVSISGSINSSTYGATSIRAIVYSSSSFRLFVNVRDDSSSWGAANCIISNSTGCNLSLYSGNSSELKIAIKFKGKGLASRIPIYTGKCKDPRKCALFYTADYSATGAISYQSTGPAFPWLTSCTNATTPTCTFHPSAGITIPPLCWAINKNDFNMQCSNGFATTSTTTAPALCDSTANRVSVARSIVCIKQGVDLENSQTNELQASLAGFINSGNFIYARFGAGADCATACSSGSCNICARERDSKYPITITHTGSTGNYEVNGIDGTKWFCHGSGVLAGTAFLVAYHDLAASNSVKARILMGSGGANYNASNGNLWCYRTNL